MTSRKVWMVLAVLYAAFFAWYTSFSGPLTPEEIAQHVAGFEARGTPPERVAVWRQFMESDTGDDFAMWNAIKVRETPLPVEGVPPGESSEQVLARYTTPFLGRALRSASHPVLMGSAAGPALDLWGIEGADQWTTGALVRYRSRRDVMAMAATAGTVHQFKVAAMEKTIAFPLDPWFHAGDPRLLLALVFALLGSLWSLRCARRLPRSD